MNQTLQQIVLQGVIDITVAEVSTSNHHATDLTGKNTAAFMNWVYAALKSMANDLESKPKID